MYLFDKNKALNALNKIAKINKKPELKLEELADISKNIEEENRAKTYTVFDLFKNKRIIFLTVFGILAFFF